MGVFYHIKVVVFHYDGLLWMVQTKEQIEFAVHENFLVGVKTVNGIMQQSVAT